MVLNRRQVLKSALASALTPILVQAAPPSAAVMDKNVIVLNAAAASVTIVDQDTRRVLWNTPVGKQPHHLMPLPNGQELIVADAVGGELNFLNPVTGVYLSTFPNIKDPYQIGFSPDARWFVANCLRLNRVDIYRYGGGHDIQLVRRIPLFSAPSHMAFSADSDKVFVSLQNSDSIAAIDLRRQRLLWKKRIGPATAGVWLTPQDEYLLVALTGQDAVIAVDWRERRIVKRIVTGLAAHNFRSMADHRHVLVSNRVSNSISIVDMLDLRKIGDIQGLPSGPDDMELSSDRRWLWVTFRFSRKVGVIDMHSQKLVDVIDVGRSPHGIYFNDRAPFYDNVPYGEQLPKPMVSVGRTL